MPADDQRDPRPADDLAASAGDAPIAPRSSSDTSSRSPEEGGSRAPRPTGGHAPPNSTETTHEHHAPPDQGHRGAPGQSGTTGGEPPPPRPDATTPAAGRDQDPAAGSARGAPATVDALHDDDTGRWQVLTAASIYVIDLDRRTVVRVPGAGAFAEGQLVGIGTMDQDNQVVHLDELRFCRRGYSMLMFTDPRPDGTSYYRLSTPVIEIRELSGKAPAPIGDRNDGGGAA